MTRNTNPNEGGPAGAQLEAKIGAYYLLALLGETEPRGMPGAVAQKVKFQRTYEEYALDDIIVLGVDAAGLSVSLEIQSKRTLEFTAGDVKFAKVIAQIVRAGDAHAAPVAAAVSASNSKIEREYHQLLQRARKLSSGADLRRALDAPRVMNQGMVAFAGAVRDLIAAAGGEATDDALWRVLRRLQILVFDFESPGALSNQLVEALCRGALGPAATARHRDLWEALIVKALSYDADGGEITRAELVAWLASEKGLLVEPARDMRLARQRFGDASDLALAAIDDSIAGVTVDRAARVAAVADQLDTARFVEIKGRSGSGKSAILKALAEQERIEGRPLVLTPPRTPGGGWLTLSTHIGFKGTPTEFLTELAASGCTTLFIDSLDRITDAGVQATIVDLLHGCASTPGMRVAATVGYDFTAEQRAWIPEGLIAALGYGSVLIGTLDEDEASALADADPRLSQLLRNPNAADLTRNLYLLRRLLGRAADALPLTEAALAVSWWEAAAKLTPVENRARLIALRVLADQALCSRTILDVSGIEPAVTQSLVDLDDVDEQFVGSTGVFHHDTLRDWAAGNLLREEPDRLDDLPLGEVASIGLARPLEFYARWLVEQEGGETAWADLLIKVSVEGVHGSWRRSVLLALVRSERAPIALDRVLPILQADDGKLLATLISNTVATDSQPAVAHFAAAGIDPARVPSELRVPVGGAWSRLMLWILGRLDDITVPVGLEILRFFKQWLMAGGGRDALSLLIVDTLYSWLVGLERQDDEDLATTFSRLFRYSGRYGAAHGLGQEIRTLFLLFCSRRPELADTYLRRHVGKRLDDEIAGDVLMLGSAIAPAAPAALADFVIDALVTAEQRYAERHGPRASGRLSFRGHERMVAGPSSGPFLALLKASKSDGLRAIRRVVDYGVGLAERSNADPPQSFDLGLPDRRLTVTMPGAYFLPRMPGGNPILASALRALEAWGHDEIEGGRPVEDVVMEVLGSPDDGMIAAPFLAVAVDLLLSHLAAPDPRLMPFMTSPELLKLDFDRYNRDYTGISCLGGEDDDSGSGPPSNADLAARRSRQTCLRWQAPGFLIHGDPAVLTELRLTLETQRDRLKEGQNVSAGPHSLQWGIEEVLRLTDLVNWKEVQVQLEDGRIEPRLTYVEPPEEAEVLDPLRATSNADLSETVLLRRLVDAAIDPGKAVPDLVEQGLAWARAEPVDELREDEEDFLVARRWRAVVAAAVLAVRSPGLAEENAWAPAILYRAAAEGSPDHGHYGMAQLQHNGRGLAVLGLAHLAAQGDEAAVSRLLEVAVTGSPAVVAAFDLVTSQLVEWHPGCLASLLRIGLEASVTPWRNWEQPEAYQAAQAERVERLRSRREQETLWLLGQGSQPPWPQLPHLRHVKKAHRLLLDDDESDTEGAAEAVIDRVLEVFNDQMAGAWLSLLETSPGAFQTQLSAEVLETYRPLSNFLAGEGLNPAVELTNMPTAWLRPFARLQLRTAVGLPWDRFKAAVLDDLLVVTDQGFYEAVEAVVPLADGLTVAGALSVEILAPFRFALCERLKRDHFWTWRKDEIGDTITSNIAGAVLALYVHSPFRWGSFDCRLPAGADVLAPILPALTDLAVDAPGSSYVATLLMNDLERASAWAPPDLLATAAEAWLAKRGADIHFWRELEFGRRVCNWFQGQLERASLDTGVFARLRVLADQLAEAGVPEALALETELAAVPTS